MASNKGRPTFWLVGNQLPYFSRILKMIPKDTAILMIESSQRGSQFRYHKKKLVLIYSAMRHMAEWLRSADWDVHYVPLGDKETFNGAIEKHLAAMNSKDIHALIPADASQESAMKKIGEDLDIRYIWHPNDLFLIPRSEFSEWAGGKKVLLLENFYRMMRKKFGILLRSDGEPEGGIWNYDSENRLPFSNKIKPVRSFLPEPDDITRQVMEEVEELFPDHPGVTTGFNYPITPEQAEAVLDDFLLHRLDQFGPYEDVMIQSEPYVYHSLLSSSLNIGLLHPQEVIRRVEELFRKGKVKLPSAEGLIRQILGWREFIHGIYWLRMPEMAQKNFLEAKRPLPDWMYTGETRMNCLRHVIGQTVDLAYAHHIQRLMVMANFMTLAGIDPGEGNRWFMEMFIDAYEWVMVPNVYGMGLYADGGGMSTKPYISSGNYINKMSNYCSSCEYDVKKKTGEDACPFNYLYWDFLDRHTDKLRSNSRMAIPYAALGKKESSELKEIRSSSESFLRDLRTKKSRQI